jgi:hypothetical protein
LGFVMDAISGCINYIGPYYEFVSTNTDFC